MAAPKSLLKGFARTVETTKPDPKKRLTIFDPDTRGLCVRITSKGGRSYNIVARNPAGRQVWAKIGDCAVITLDEARTLASEGVGRVKAGEVAFPKVEPPTAPESFRAVAGNFLERHVKRQGLRSADEVERIFNVYIFPEWGARPFAEIRRGDVARLLDRVEDGNGPVMADRVLATLSKLFNWYASRSEDYSSPIVRGMARSKPRERARSRILSDDEIRLLWPLLTGTFDAFIKVSLLTGQRRTKVAEMCWTNIADDGTWTIPTEPREKNNPGRLKLPDSVLAIIHEQPEIAGNEFVFAGRGGTHISGFGLLKSTLDKRVTAANDGTALNNWTLHDFRRTAKSLMARAGVRPDISERVLGHVIAGVEGIYDRHSYTDEKADALERLGAVVERIVNPAAGNVVSIAVEA